MESSAFDTIKRSKKPQVKNSQQRMKVKALFPSSEGDVEQFSFDNTEFLMVQAICAENRQRLDSRTKRFLLQSSSLAQVGGGVECEEKDCKANEGVEFLPSGGPEGKFETLLPSGGQKKRHRL